jgi:type I restriction enzyme S subunit
VKSKWKDQTLGDVLDVIKNGLNCKQSREGDGDPISRIETIAKGEFNHEKVGRSILTDADKDKYRLKAGDILFSHINSPPHIGKSALLGSDDTIYHGVNLLLFRPKGHVDVGFLQRYRSYLYISEFWRSRCKQSVNQASVNQTDIKGVPIPVPPLEEQQRIVAVLDEAFKGLARARAHAEANLQNARELFESIKADELAYTGPDREEVILSEVADIKSGLVDPREDAFADLLHLGAGNMITGTDELVDVKTAREEKLKSGKYLFDETTILYSKIRPYLRKAARIRTHNQNMTVAARAIAERKTVGDLS